MLCDSYGSYVMNQEQATPLQWQKWPRAPPILMSKTLEVSENSF